jgi:hypothetical protein
MLTCTGDGGWKQTTQCLWIAEYPDTATRNRDVQIVLQSSKFTPVTEYIETLIQDFQRITSEVQ